MPRWLTGLLVLLLLLLFVLPNPTAAGNWVGNAIDSTVLFFRSAGNEVAGTVTTSGSYTDGSGSTGGRDPSGGVPSGDGTYLAAAPAALAAVLPAPLDASVDTGGEGTLPRSRPVGLRIPGLGVSSLFVGLGLEPDGTLQVPKTAQAVGWYRDAPTPGERGAAVVTAHVDWLHEKGVFHDLGRMRPGDEVTVDRADGAAAVFRVTGVEEYPKQHFPTEKVYGDTDDAELRLITCGGRFDPATGSYSDNVVVYARMARVVR
jgi:LPXTG-site transpeptidase (sortase) family protein